MKRVISKFFVAAAAVAALAVPSMSFADSYENNECNECDGVFTISADLLILKPCFDAAWATRAEGGVTHGVYVDYDWELGFRVDAQYMDGCNSWDIAAGYTFFDQDVTHSYAVPAAGVVFTPTGGTAAALASTTATVKHDLEYGELNVVLGHSCCLCDGFVLRAFGGFKGLFIEQTANTSFEIAGPTAQTVHARVDYDGYGLTGGFTPVLNLADSCCKNECWDYELAIIGETSASVVVGENEHTVKRDGTLIESNKRDCHCTLGTRLAMGFTADSCYCNTRIGLSAGYEFNQWEDVRSVYDQDDSGYLGLHGVFIRGALSF